MRGNRLCRLVLGGLLAVPAAAQMAGMNHQNFNRAGMYLMNMSSGTAMNPYSWQMPMLMTQAGSWNLMFMGQAFLVDTQQSAPRGGDKLYSTNWFMTSAIRSLGGGRLFAHRDAEPGTGDHHQPELPAALSNRRNRLRAAAGGRAASARFPDEPERAVRPSAGPAIRCCNSTTRRWATPPWDRWRSRTARRPRNCRRPRWATTGRIPRTSPITWRPSPCGTNGCAWRPAAFTEPSRMKTAGISTGAE